MAKYKSKTADQLLNKSKLTPEEYDRVKHLARAQNYKFENGKYVKTMRRIKGIATLIGKSKKFVIYSDRFHERIFVRDLVFDKNLRVFKLSITMNLKEAKLFSEGLDNGNDLTYLYSQHAELKFTQLNLGRGHK